MHVHIDFKNLTVGYFIGALSMSLAWGYFEKLNTVEDRITKRNAAIELARDQIKSLKCLPNKPKRLSIGESQYGVLVTTECQ